MDHNERMDAESTGADRLVEVETVVHARTLDALVEPHRDAVGLFEEPRATRMAERIAAARQAPGPGPGAKSASSFLDDWLTERAKRPPKAGD